MHVPYALSVLYAVTMLTLHVSAFCAFCVVQFSELGSEYKY